MRHREHDRRFDEDVFNHLQEGLFAAPLVVIAQNLREENHFLIAKFGFKTFGQDLADADSAVDDIFGRGVVAGGVEFFKSFAAASLPVLEVCFDFSAGLVARALDCPATVRLAIFVDEIECFRLVRFVLARGTIRAPLQSRRWKVHLKMCRAKALRL